MDFLRFYLDPATGEPHIHEHGVSEEEVERLYGTRARSGLAGGARGS